VTEDRNEYKEALLAILKAAAVYDLPGAPPCPRELSEALWAAKPLFLPFARPGKRNA
jgi:hypothetical protein